MRRFIAACLCQLEFWVNDINQLIYDRHKISRSPAEAPWIKVMPDWAERELAKDP